jgi:hypothetical protein
MEDEDSMLGKHIRGSIVTQSREDAEEINTEHLFWFCPRALCALTKQPGYTREPSAKDSLLRPCRRLWQMLLIFYPHNQPARVLRAGG